MSVQYIKTPGGEELAVLPREDYEDLVDAMAGQRAVEALASGEEELFSAEEARALLAAPTPLAFWREKRTMSLAELAGRLGLSVQELDEAERGLRHLPLPAYRRAAHILSVSLDDLATT